LRRASDVNAIMFENYFKSALRVILKHKGYSFISIAGLAVGMAVFIVIFFFVRYEFSYDDFNENFDRIYRVEEFYKSNYAYGRFPRTPAPLTQVLEQNYPEIIDSTRVAVMGRRFLSTASGDKKIYRKNGRYADRSFFNVFSLPLIKGDPETALLEPFSMVLTEELAGTYFPGEEPLGKTVRIQGRFDCTVTGVAKKIPGNSHIKFHYLVSLTSITGKTLKNWDEDLVYSYILTRKKHSHKDINRKIENLLLNNRKGDRKNDKVMLYLNPLPALHHSNTNYELESAIPKQILYVILAIGILILSISCINFINLATAYSSIRGKEVGVRKVVGASRFSLIKHYLSESVLLSFISFAIAWALAELSVIEFNRLLNTNIEITLSGFWQFISASLVFVLIIGVLSGSYPAFLLSSFHPVKVLKGTLTLGRKGPVLRKVSVTLQFLFCITFIILSVVFYKQGSYLQNMDKGFSEDNILVQRFDNLGDKSIDKSILLKNELLKKPDILSAAVSGNLPSAIYNDKKLHELRLFNDPFAGSFIEFKNLNKLLAYFSILSVILAALGLYAIASFATRQRAKEIGIRKVIGASVSKVFLLLLKEFVKILAIANLIAWPIAYFVMNNFLRQFASGIDLQAWMFLLSSLLVFAAAAVTVGYHTIKTALTDPVEALRYE
jgi:putative ABC transport system permease protein